VKRHLIAVGLVLWCRAGSATAQTVDSTWLKTDARAKTVRISLTSGLTDLNSGLNFNGFNNGGLTITVPQGWTVEVSFENHDPSQPHSAMVIVADSLPTMPSKPVFAGAITRDATNGLPPGSKDHFRFKAGKTGNFYFYCGVLGHGAVGMYIRLIISADVQAPTIRT
jgi:sulfocyanin